MDRNGIEFLEDEHARLQDLFRRVSSPDEDRRAVLKDLMQALATHVDLEAQVLVPVLERHGDGGTEIADRLGDEHHQVHKALTLLERRKVNSPDVPDLVNDLLAVTDRHIAEATATVFPRLRETLSADELDALGQEMVSDDRRVLTHAHPGLPDSGPLAGLAGKAAEIVDRIRDRSDDINRTSS